MSEREREREREQIREFKLGIRCNHFLHSKLCNEGDNKEEENGK